MSTTEASTVAETKPERPKPEVVKGWRRMGKLLEVNRDTVRVYASRDVDPLPVWYDHAGRPRVYLSALLDWVDRQAMFYRSYHELKRAGRLPRQVRKDQAPRKRQRRTKVARRVAKKKDVT